MFLELWQNFCSKSEKGKNGNRPSVVNVRARGGEANEMKHELVKRCPEKERMFAERETKRNKTFCFRDCKKRYFPLLMNRIFSH